MTAKRIALTALAVLIGIPVAWYALILVIGAVSPVTS
jgi:hypothetical protein